MPDSIDSLIEEAQKYVIGVTSSQEDFIKPKYSPYYPDLEIVPSKSSQDYISNKSSKKEQIQKVNISQFKKEAETLDLEEVRNNTVLTKPVKSPYKLPAKEALLLKIPEPPDTSEANDFINKESKQTTVPSRKIDNISNNKLDNKSDSIDSILGSVLDLKDSLLGDITSDILADTSEKKEVVPEKKLKDLRILPKDKFEIKTDQGPYSSEYGAAATRDNLESSMSLGSQLFQELNTKNNQARVPASEENESEDNTSNNTSNTSNSNSSIWSIIEDGEVKSSYQKDIVTDREVLKKNLSTPDENDTPDSLDGVKKPRYKTIVQNHPISGLLSTGADAMQNAFDVFFYYPTIGYESTQIGSFKNNAYEEDASLSKTLDPNSPLLKLVAKMTGLTDDSEDSESIIRYFKNLMMPSVFSTRVQSITIPQVNISTNTVNFLNKAISKQGAPSLEQKLSFTIRTDQNLYIIDSFNYMAGQCALLSGFLDEKNLHEKVKALRSIPKIWNKMRPLQGGYRISDPGLCLIVQLRNLGQQNVDNVIALTNSQQTINDYTVADDLMPYYVFENVKILGSDDSINFNNGSPNMGQTMNIQFIYRRLVKVIISLSEKEEVTIPMSINKRRNSNIIWY